ncbi:MAG TPA: hypothetical protein VL689_13725 [Paraburkholderia sp.]|nr:hypothetical protein [Paraburkholderia sp.]
MLGRCVLMFLMVGTLCSLTGCNTVAGFGQDIEQSARAVQRVM